MTDPSLVRRAMDELFARYPDRDIVSVDWGDEDDLPYLPGWVIVILTGKPRGSSIVATRPFAIWRTTGALHSMHEGAVSDDPIWTP